MFHYFDWARGMAEVEAVYRDWHAGDLLWAHYYRILGRLEEARRLQAQVDPLELESGPALWHSMAAKYLDGEYVEVVEGGRKDQQTDPEHHAGCQIEAWGHLGLRD